LKPAEAYWDAATGVLNRLLPERFSSEPRRWTGINLGTFTGVFQKAWMRRGYAMYGIEVEDVIDDLHAYGCDGHRDNVFDMSSIAGKRFDFAVLDRVFCQKEFFEKYEIRKRGSGHPPPYFSKIRRVLKDDGAFIGVLYDWYSRSIVDELATLGRLKVWPLKSGRLAFCVDMASAAQAPDPMPENLSDPGFVDAKIGGVRGRLFVPTNEFVWEQEGRRNVAFAPLLREKNKPVRTVKRKKPFSQAP
jgi:SAM-dependent methyltransferase